MDDPRPWARGKTAEELLGLTDQTIGALQQLAMMPAPQPVQAPVDQSFDINDDDIIDGRKLKQIIGQYQQAPRGPDVVALQIAGQMARQQNADVTGKWGHEYDAEVAKLPPDLRTLDNLNYVAQIVRGRHVNELAEEKARELAAKQGFSIRTNGAGSPGSPDSPSSLESDALPAEYRDRLKKAGITERQARDFASKVGMTFEQWLKSAKGVSTIGED